MNNNSFQIEQDLLNCGLSQESIQSIRDTTVITRNGSQHVVPQSQSYLDASGRQEHASTIIDSSMQENSSLVHRLHEQQNMFSRYKQFSDNRIATLERNLSSTMEQLKQLQSQVATIKSNQQAQNRVAFSSPSAHQQESPSSSPSPSRQADISKPIDRNNVSPVDVKVENIFYCGER